MPAEQLKYQALKGSLHSCQDGLALSSSSRRTGLIAKQNRGSTSHPSCQGEHVFIIAHSALWLLPLLTESPGVHCFVNGGPIEQRDQVSTMATSRAVGLSRLHCRKDWFADGWSPSKFGFASPLLGSNIRWHSRKLKLLSANGLLLLLVKFCSPCDLGRGYLYCLPSPKSVLAQR